MLLESPASESRWRRWSLQVCCVVLVAILFYGALALWVDTEELGEAWRLFPIDRAPWVIALVVLGLLLRALRWQYYTRALGLDLPWGANFVAFAASFTFTASPGKVGEILKSVLLRRRYGTAMTSTVGILVAERTTDLLAILLISALGLGRLGAWKWTFGLVVAILVAVYIVLSNRRLYLPLMTGLGRVPGLGRLAKPLGDLLESSRDLFRARHLGIGTILALVAWSCEALALFFVLEPLAPAIRIPDAFFAFGASSLMGVVSMLPGGIGGFEGAMLVILQGMHVGRPEALAATLLIRLGTLWLVSVLGLIFLGVWFLIFAREDRANTLAS